MNRHINMNLVYEHSITQRDINLKNSRTGFLCFIFFFYAGDCAFGIRKRHHAERHQIGKR